METLTKTCGPIPGGLTLTHLLIKEHGTTCAAGQLRRPKLSGPLRGGTSRTLRLSAKLAILPRAEELLDGYVANSYSQKVRIYIRPFDLSRGFG